MRAYVQRVAGLSAWTTQTSKRRRAVGDTVSDSIRSILCSTRRPLVYFAASCQHNSFKFRKSLNFFQFFIFTIGQPIACHLCIGYCTLLLWTINKLCKLNLTDPVFEPRPSAPIAICSTTTLTPSSLVSTLGRG